MSQVQILRFCWWCLAVAIPFSGRRIRYGLALSASVWLDARAWPVRDPRGWWAFRRRYGRLIRACRRYGFVIEA